MLSIKGLIKKVDLFEVSHAIDLNSAPEGCSVAINDVISDVLGSHEVLHYTYSVFNCLLLGEVLVIAR
jgi:hypothetical protein